MSKVKICGTIVSADYDCATFESWINNGTITPSSRVVSAIETATEPIDVYISSYGGDVFAGGEMMIALLKAAAAKKLATVEVGSIAASMAANIIAALRAAGVSVVCNRNTELMFHGCYTVTEGGAQHHEDIADSLRNINNSVITNLNKIGITDCRAWFAEGREKWLSADDCLDLGLVNAVIDSGDVLPMIDGRKTAARLAAFASKIHDKVSHEMEIDTMINDKSKTESVEANIEPQTDSVAVEPPTVEPDFEARVNAAVNERFSGLQAKHDKMISDMNAKIDGLTADLATAQAERDQLAESVKALTADLAHSRDQLVAEQNAHERITTAAIGKPGKPQENVSPREVLSRLPLSQRAAYYKAHAAEIDGK